MTDIDSIFDEMRLAALDPRLEGMTDTVIRLASAQRARGDIRKRLGMTGALALVAGVLAGVVSPSIPGPHERLLNAAPAIAPSYLLVGVR